MSNILHQARTGLCATVPWPIISVSVNIQRCLKQTIRQYETKIKGAGRE